MLSVGISILIGLVVDVFFVVSNSGLLVLVMVARG